MGLCCAFFFSYSESVTNCHRLKLEAADGKSYLTDVATAETLLRLIQSVPSPKAEPIKLWLAKVGYERMQEMADPSKSLDRARETWQKHGYSEKWILFFVLTLYGEARGENAASRQAIAWVIRNRLTKKIFGDSYRSIVLKPLQFSCWRKNDPRAC